MKKLTREEMKLIVAGESQPATCSANCIGGGTVDCDGASCEAHDYVGGVNGYCIAACKTKYC